MCYCCNVKEAEHWCADDCKHSFCSNCWALIHEHGQYRTHKKIPMKEKPPDIPQCDEHEQENHELKYWCEGCSKEICSNCQTYRHKDHKFILITDYCKSLQEKVNFSC